MDEIPRYDFFIETASVKELISLHRKVGRPKTLDDHLYGTSAAALDRVRF